VTFAPSPPPSAPVPSSFVGRDEQNALLRTVMEEARDLGLLGPGPVEPHIRRALGASRLLVGAHRILDLGSGGGLPGLPLAWSGVGEEWVLLDGSVRRCQFLVRSVERLGLAGRVEVVASRAEEAARGPARGSFDAVVARSFGPPAVTAECAAGFLRVGGRLLVAEPPPGSSEAIARWRVDGLATLGLEPLELAEAREAGFQVLLQSHPCPDRYPRRTGVPNKRPLFRA
jgi:16S rRNA (guanine527-N7)-methyltransferase